MRCMEKATPSQLTSLRGLLLQGFHLGEWPLRSRVSAAAALGLGVERELARMTLQYFFGHPRSTSIAAIPYLVRPETRQTSAV